jgi:hypothetical protein
MVGARIGVIDSLIDNPSDTPPFSDILQKIEDNGNEMLGEKLFPPRDSVTGFHRFLPLVNITSEKHGEADRTYITMSVLLSKDRAMMDQDDKFNEIGIYAQVMWNPAPSWSPDVWQAGSFRLNDIVEHNGEHWVSLAQNNTEEPRRRREDDPSDWLPSWSPREYITNTIITAGTVWVPPPGDVGNPFLVYYVAKYKYPICLEFGSTIRYTLAIELQGVDSLGSESVLIPQEDTIAFPEIQLAYLENISQALRAARNEQRIGEVAINSLGPWREGVAYRTNDVVTFNGKLYSWQFSVPSIGPQTGAVRKPPEPYWVELTPDIINRRDNWIRGQSYRSLQVVVWKRQVWRAPLGSATITEPGSPEGQSFWVLLF